MLRAWDTDAELPESVLRAADARLAQVREYDIPAHYRLTVAERIAWTAIMVASVCVFALAGYGLWTIVGNL